MYHLTKHIICVFALMLLFSEALGAEWVVCDLAPAADDVTQIGVVIDGQPEIINPYTTMIADGIEVVRVLDITTIPSASLNVRFINSQGRASDPVPFDLSAKPSGPSSYRIIQD